MHVLFTLDTWGLIGGTERYAVVVVPALLEDGHRVTILCRDDRSADDKAGVLPRGVDVIEVPELEQAHLWRSARRDLERRVRAAAPDVIYVSTLRNLSAIEILLDVAPLVRYVHDHTLFCPGLNKYREDGELCRAPLGLACMERYWLRNGCICFKPAGHANKIADPLRELRSRWNEIELTQRAARVLTNSNYMRAELLKVGFAPERTDVLYLFTRSNTSAQPKGPLPAETQAFLTATEGALLFTPARLTLPDKGVDFLMTALSGVKGSFRAVVAGSGPAEEWLRQKAREEGLGHKVHFTGWLDSAGVETLYEEADVIVCPSVWDEPFGLVGIEAMAHAKPVVAFEVGGIPEWLVHGETGYLVERKDTPAMAAMIDRLLEQPDEREKLGRAGKARVDEVFPRAAHVQRLEELLAASCA